MAVEAAPDRARREVLPVTPFEMSGDLGKRDVAPRLDETENLPGVRLDPTRALVASLTERRDRAAVTPAPRPLDGRRGDNAEPLGGSAARGAFSYGIDDTRSKIVGKRLGHEGWPPPPALSMNHCSRQKGIPLPIPPDRKML